VYEICAKNTFARNIDVCSKFYCVRSSHNLCACAHEHSLEGALLISISLKLHFKHFLQRYYRNLKAQFCLEGKLTMTRLKSFLLRKRKFSKLSTPDECQLEHFIELINRSLRFFLKTKNRQKLKLYCSFSSFSINQ